MDASTSKLFATHGQVSLLVQPLSNGIKGHASSSMFKDGLIVEKSIVGVVIAGKAGERQVCVKLKEGSAVELASLHRTSVMVE